MFRKGGASLEATIQGCTLFYRWQHPENAKGPTVLLLHGWGCDSSIFSFIESGMPADASVLTIDFPGHGKSGEPSQPWGVKEYAQQLLQLMDTLKIQRVRMIAHSFGGRIAIYLASHYPERVEKMVITGGAGIRKPISESQKKRQARYKRWNSFFNALKRFKPFTRIVERWQTALRRRYGSADYNRLNENMRKTFVKVISEDLLPFLNDIQAPTLLIWGSEDTETPLWMGQEMEKRIPDAGLVVFEGRSHFAFVEEWQRFLMIVKEFFWGGEKA